MVKGSEVTVVSKHTIRPTTPKTNQESETQKRIHLTPWDLQLMSWDCIQKGILFNKPHKSTDLTTVSSLLLSSFSAALDHFYPLAGRLVTTNHGPDSLSISLDCTDQGAEFVHATALDVTVSDILGAPPHDYYVPPVVRSFFAGESLFSHDGHVGPLLAVQVTEIADGIFVAITLNHVVADGTFFWHFFNTWSKICRTGGEVDTDPPAAFERWFPDSCQPPIRLPFGKVEDFIKRVQLPTMKECFFHFPAENIAKLKSKSNAEMGTREISSLQSLLAHVWRSVTRARGLKPEEETVYSVAVGYRSRIDPPLPSGYLGNAVSAVHARAPAGEVVGRGLGWVAWQLNRAIASQNISTGMTTVASKWVESWLAKPDFHYLDGISPENMITGSSPRFDVYGNDFGWGRPIAVRSGRASKFDGKATVYQGPETGSIGLELSLSPEALSALVEDVEFMEVVGN